MAAGITRAMTTVGAATMLATTRLRTFAAGALVLCSVGGMRAVLGGIAASLVALAKAPFAMIGAGPVSYSKPYLVVGERGPELFVPGLTGRIETNDTLRGLTADSAAAVAGSTSSTTNRGPATITNNWTINGADNPHEVVQQIDSRFAQLLRQMEAEQRAFLSD